MRGRPPSASGVPCAAPRCRPDGRLPDDPRAARKRVPSWDLFDAQPQSYRDEVLPPRTTARLAVELGVRQGWDRYVGGRGDMLGIDAFGASAPAKVLLEKYGFTVDAVVARARRLLAA